MKYLRYIFPILTLCVFAHVASGQTSTIYYMGTVPQSYYLNPATQPFCNVYVGVPVASQIHLRANTGNISASDFFLDDPASDSIITPMHPRGDLDAFINKLDDIESIGIEAGSSILSFGFRAKEMYFSFDATLHTTTQLNYSKNFIEGRLGGFANGKTYDLSKGSIEHLDYSSFSVNISRKFNDDLQIGIRPKILFGLGVLQTSNNNTSLYTSTEEWIFNADYEAQIAALGVTIPVDEDGVYDPEGEIEFDSTLITPTGYQKILSGNRGFGIDIGAHYKPIENVQLSLSILDLGSIKWKDNTHVATIKGSYTFEGISISDTSNFTENVIDSVKENMNIAGSDKAFTSRLTPKVIVGGRYFITPGFDLGLLYRMDFHKAYTDHDLIFSANWHPIPFLSVSSSYSLINTRYSTLGLGLGMKFGPLNFYMVLDDVPLRYDKLSKEDLPVAIPLPIAQSDYNVRFGLNFVFGCNQYKKLKQDKALFNSSDWIL